MFKVLLHVFFSQSETMASHQSAEVLSLKKERREKDFILAILTKYFQPRTCNLN
jgi:hypothetical protein